MADRMNTEIQKSLALLDKLTTHKPPLSPLGELNPKLLAGCRVSTTGRPCQQQRHLAPITVLICSQQRC